MVRRVLEIILGLIIGLSLFASYSDDTHESKLLLWYILTPRVLQIIVWIALFFVASRLIYGKPKDYSKYFYNLFVKLFGDPKKADKKI
jgi:hypothetical protein